MAKATGGEVLVRLMGDVDQLIETSAVQGESMGTLGRAVQKVQTHVTSVQGAMTSMQGAMTSMQASMASMQATVGEVAEAVGELQSLAKRQVKHLVRMGRNLRDLAGVVDDHDRRLTLLERAGR